MTVGIVIAALVMLGLALLWWSRSRGDGLRTEWLGNPDRGRAEPVIRTESRHNDSPNAADLDKKSGRHDG